MSIGKCLSCGKIPIDEMQAVSAHEEKTDFYEMRRLWAEYASTNPRLSDRGFRLGYWLSRRMNGNDRCCWYSIKRIAAEIGWSARSVQRGLSDLKAANLLIVVERKGRASVYHLHAPFIAL